MTKRQQPEDDPMRPLVRLVNGHISHWPELAPTEVPRILQELIFAHYSELAWIAERLEIIAVRAPATVDISDTNGEL